MLFGDADIEIAVWKFLGKGAETSAHFHGRSYGTDIVVFPGQFYHHLSEYLTVARRRPPVGLPVGPARQTVKLL